MRGPPGRFFAGGGHGAVLIFLSLLFWSTISMATPDYHLVGWTNVILPGGGSLLLGRPMAAAEQFVLEVGTFNWGYSLSARTPFTLDGVPESIPNANTQILQNHSTTSTCTLTNAKGQCLRYRKVKSTTSKLVYDGSAQDITRPLYADILQEIGLKAHMVNIFDSYRTAARDQGVDLRVEQIDTHDTGDLFLAPFDRARVFDPWVSVPLGLSAIALYVAYRSNLAQVQLVPPLNTRSTRLYEATYLGVFPLGSAAPEEMFYRGFLQSQLLQVTRTPWVAVPVSSALYTFSHTSDDYLGAAVSGLYLGFMTFHDHGDLRRGIAYHFWSDIMSGVYAIALLKLGQKAASAASPPASMTLNFEF